MPKLTNFQMHVLAFIALMATMAMVCYVDINMYKTALEFFGAWAIGSKVRQLCHETWPLENEDD